MTDDQKQQLILAAKASGVILCHWNDGKEPYSSGEGFCTPDNRLWNPYQNDAQCLQLMRALDISLDYDDCCAWYRYDDSSMTLLQEFWCGDCWKDDREAVVAVAALMGGKL